jgi:hypothetical protein
MRFACFAAAVLSVVLENKLTAALGLTQFDYATQEPLELAQ